MENTPIPDRIIFNEFEWIDNHRSDYEGFDGKEEDSARWNGDDCKSFFLLLFLHSFSDGFFFPLIYKIKRSFSFPIFLFLSFLFPFFFPSVTFSVTVFLTSFFFIVNEIRRISHYISSYVFFLFYERFFRGKKHQNVKRIRSGFFFVFLLKFVFSLDVTWREVLLAPF